ncbi:MAG: precorrin-3B C(17)-methyltransferase [Lachnospiraceae bacterium]|nr:precorrin-3B C(17)-methyltransferase [Lachnospiraceae bacterium]
MSKMYVVGIGPGGYEYMTIKAANVLKEVDVIVGYTVYIDLVKDQFPDKEFLSTPMRKEVDRCRLAFEEAAKGKNVAMICSGDAGVYGMSGLMLTIGAEEFPDIPVEIVSGVTATLSGASVLGAPLIHDFAVISLSDLLTPWEVIVKRIEAAAESDMAICFYNPSSKKRHDYLQKACDIILKHRSPENVCGTVENIGREGESFKVYTLKELRDTQVDMFTTVFVGNSKTQVINGRMVTPRGYRGVED